LRRHWAIALPAFIYLYIFPYIPGLRSPNELSRLMQSRALVDLHALEITQELKLHGTVGDLSCVAVMRAPDGQVAARLPCPQAAGKKEFGERHYYPSKAPLLSLAAAPVYALLKAFRSDVPELALVFFARGFCVILPSILLLALMRRFLRHAVSPETADLVTLCYALGSLAFSYSEQFISHQSTAVLAFSCFFVLWRLRRREWSGGGYVVAGLLAGLTVAAEYTGALALIPLGIYGLSGIRGLRAGVRALLLVALGLSVPVLLLAAYHQAAFGSPLATGYQYLNDMRYQGWHQGGFLGIKLPQARAFIQSFLSPARGLLVLSPMLVLALPCLFRARTWRMRDAELLLSLGMLLLYAYFTSSFSYDSWGWTTGPRHLTPLVPFLLLPIARLLDSLRIRSAEAPTAHGTWFQVGAVGLATALLMLSVANTSLMTLLNYISPKFTNPLYQIALPFVLQGYLPHSWLSLAGVPNPWAAIPALVGLALAVILSGVTMLRTLPGKRRMFGLLVTLAAAGLAVFAHASIRPPAGRAASERQAAEFMKSVYSPKPHAPPLRLWISDRAVPASRGQAAQGVVAGVLGPRSSGAIAVASSYQTNKLWPAPSRQEPSSVAGEARAMNEW